MKFLKDIKRIISWVLFFVRTGSLKSVSTIIEVGGGTSARIQFALLLTFFRGNYLSVDLNPANEINFRFPFKRKFIEEDFFNLKQKTDLIIFDHSIDDILAFMLEDLQNNKTYSEIMKNIKFFDYNNTDFLAKIRKILITAQKLLNYKGKIAISNYPTKHDKQKGTIDIMNKLLFCIADEAEKLDYKIKFLSKKFLLLNKT